MSVLTIRSLSKTFGGVRAVNGVSFEIAQGEFLAMIGPNGAGKSTCFNMINGQLQPDSGEILLAGRSIAGTRGPRYLEAWSRAYVSGCRHFWVNDRCRKRANGSDFACA